MSNPTIKDVARLAGVSTATVSRVVNQKGYISPEIDLKVKQAIESLGYKPNAIARSLKNNSTNTIGMVVADIANPFFTWAAKALESAVNEQNYNLIICSTEESQEKEIKYLNMLSEKRVDGIVLSTTGKNNDYIKQMNKSGMPVVLIDRRNDELELDLVTDNNFSGAGMLVNHLIEKGHRKIALLKGHPMSSTSNERCDGYFKALSDAGISVNKEYVFVGGRSGETAFKATKDILAMKDRPTAIFAVNNLIARNVIMALNTENIKMPDDIALVCYGLEEFKTLFNPSVTCIVQKPAMIGSKAGEIILKRIRDHSITKRVEVIYSPEMYIGGSV